MWSAGEAVRRWETDIRDKGVVEEFGVNGQPAGTADGLDGEVLDRRVVGFDVVIKTALGWRRKSVLTDSTRTTAYSSRP
jgi:hypothetical protein